MEPNNANVPEKDPAAVPQEPAEQSRAEPSADPPAANVPPADLPASAAVASEQVATGGASADNPVSGNQTEPAPAAVSPPPEISAEEKDRRKKNLDTARTQVLDVLAAYPRPKPPALTAPAEAYLQTLRESLNPAADEWQHFRGLLAEKWSGALAPEKQQYAQAEADVQQHQAVYSTLFEQLVPLEQSLAGEVERMREDQDAFQTAPPELQVALLNYKKGIEIIGRMVKRLQDRKKPPAALPPVPADPAIPEAAPASEQWVAVLGQLCQTFHDSRSARGEALRNAQKTADQVKRETLAVVKNLLGAIDGVESGLRSENELLGNLQQHRPAHDALIDAWFQAYRRIDESMKPFFAATGLQPQVVDPGTPFHPDTMEPGGTVSDPSRNNEDVASVLRRGYKLHGEPIRPILVEVVVN